MNFRTVWMAAVILGCLHPAVIFAAGEAVPSPASGTLTAEAGAPESFKDQVRALAEAQQKIGDLSADFSLAIQGAAPGGGVWKARGHIALAAGRRYRVEYISPEAQLLVSDGQQRWLHLKKINQVQKQALPAAGNPSEFFLELGGGLAELLQRCRVTRVVQAGPQVWEYTCVPRAGEELNFQSARIRVFGPLRLPAQVEIQAARPVTLVLKNVKINTRDSLEKGHPGLPASLFEFTPPEGAEVIEPLWP